MSSILVFSWETINATLVRLGMLEMWRYSLVWLDLFSYISRFPSCMLDASYSYACKFKKMHRGCPASMPMKKKQHSVCVSAIIRANRSNQTNQSKLGEPYQANLDRARESSSQTLAFVGTARFLM